MRQYETIIKNWNRKVKSEKKIFQYMENFKLIFSYHSGRMENPEITFDDTRGIFENGKVIAYTGDIKTLWEIQNLKDCVDLILESVAERRRIDIDLIKKFHFALTKYTYDERRYIDNEERPGEFKKHDYITGINEVGAAPEEVEQELLELTDEIQNDYPLNNVITVGAYFHLKFENIHPFADGNGRTGRALLNYFLILNGHPPVCIYDEDKRQYIEALRIYDTNVDISPMEEFLKDQVEKTWQKTRSLTEIPLSMER
ncbi:MAG: Fic family protein [Eubacteriales bacterium]|nr:Fic family protein [Eubacteriales bacterium]